MPIWWDNTKNAILNRLWSHHICGCIFIFLTILNIAILLGYLIPIWVFSPIQTTCSVKTSQIQPKYIGNEYITFKKYRSAISVNYPGPGNIQQNSTNYGPTNEHFSDLKERGYGLSLFYATEWRSTWVSRKNFVCYYSLYDPSIVVFEYSPHYNWFLFTPFVPLILAIAFCLYPACYQCAAKRQKDKDLAEEFAKYDAKRSEAQELRRKLAQEGGLMDSSMVDMNSFDPDEEPYQIEKIENIGEYFEQEKPVLLAKQELLLDLQ